MFKDFVQLYGAGCDYLISCLVEKLFANLESSIVSALHSQTVLCTLYLGLLPLAAI